MHALPAPPSTIRFDRLKLRHLKCLALVAQERSLVRAAKALAQTQPAVSKTIAELEDIVGRPLLMRRRRGVELTATGETLVHHAVATLRGLREGFALALAHPGTEPLRLAVGVLPNVATSLLPAAVAHLARQHPALQVRVTSGTNLQLMVQLRQGEIDLVLGRLAQPSALAGLSFRQLYSEPLLLVARAGHPLSRRRRLSLDAVGAFPLVMPAGHGTRVRDAAEAFFSARGVRLPPWLVEATDTSFALGLLERSDAIWFAPQGAAQVALERGEVRRLAIDTSATMSPVGVTTRHDAPIGPGARRLIEAIEAVRHRH